MALCLLSLPPNSPSYSPDLFLLLQVSTSSSVGARHVPSPRSRDRPQTPTPQEGRVGTNRVGTREGTKEGGGRGSLKVVGVGLFI